MLTYLVRFLNDHLVLRVDVQPRVVIDDTSFEESSHDGVSDVHLLTSQRVQECTRVAVDDSLLNLR